MACIGSRRVPMPAGLAVGRVREEPRVPPPVSRLRFIRRVLATTVDYRCHSGNGCTHTRARPVIKGGDEYRSENVLKRGVASLHKTAICALCAPRRPHTSNSFHSSGGGAGRVLLEHPRDTELHGHHNLRHRVPHTLPVVLRNAAVLPVDVLRIPPLIGARKIDRY